MLAPAFHLLRTACLGFRHLDTAMALDRCAMPPPDDVKPKTPFRVFFGPTMHTGSRRILTVVPYAKDCLRILRRPFRPQDVAALASLGTAVKIRNPHNWIAEGVVSRVADYDDAKPLTP